MNFTYQKTLNQNTKSLTQLIEQKIAYMIEKFDCEISFRDCIGFIVNTHLDTNQILKPYNGHFNPFCSYLKKNAWHCCRKPMDHFAARMQELQKPVYCSCPMGMEQFCFPILLSGKLVGMIFIGMYCRDREAALDKLKQLCTEEELDFLTCEKLLFESVSQINFNISELETEAELLCSLIALLYANELQNTPEAYGRFLLNRKNDASIFEQAADYIKKNYKTDLSLTDIANACFCNPNYLSNGFIKRYGVSVGEYIKEIRLKKAMEFLSMTNMSVRDIAIETGFNYSSYLSKKFKKKTGYTPLQYRRMVKIG